MASQGLFSEATTVQHGLIARLTQPDLGWRYVPGKSLHRPTDSPFVEEELAAALLRLNPTLRAAPERIDEVIPRLRATALEATNDGVVAANERMMTWMRGTQVIRFRGNRTLTPLKLVDFDVLDANSFFLSDEVTFGPAGRQRRFDLVLWANGLPLVVGEAKSPVGLDVSWLTAAREISNIYEVDCAPFFVSNVLSFATDGREFHYGAVGQRPEHWPMWGSTTDPEGPRGWLGVLRQVELLCAPKRVLSILRDYTLFERGAGRRTKLIPRYAQIEGAEAIHSRVLSADKQRGLIWHYQGTGKTLLMLFAALRLLNDKHVGGPTVVIVLDRVDLVEQTVRQFQTVGLPTLRVAGSREDLRRLLAEDQRGVIITTIFRFSDSPTLNQRTNVIVMIDEAHRTQDGILGRDLRRALPHAQFFGLTGSPIADSERNTYKLFGDPTDPGWVLNEYSMSRSITDGTSVPIHVETRLVDYHIDAARIDEAFAAMALEERLDEAEREALATRAGATKTLMANPRRVRAVCNDIVDHYLNRVAPLGLKAQVVAYDRQLCVEYHQEITSILQEREIPLQVEVTVVMTVGTTKDEPPEWRDRYALDPGAEAKVKARFNRADDPLSILIVTSKLLTGFDAPIEGVLYLDKPLRRHTLFQAMCRTNRRYTNVETGQEKQYGLVVDYVGLGGELVRALRAADPSGGATEHAMFSDLIGELRSGIASILQRFEGIDRGETSIEALFEAQDRIPVGAVRNEFAGEFSALQSLWEFIWPDDALRALRRDYRWLALVYESVRPPQMDDELIWHRLGAKTLDIVYEAISDVQVTSTGQSEIIVDADLLEAIDELRGSPAEGRGDEGTITVEDALDTIEARLRMRIASSRGHVVYVSLSDRLERLRRQQLERTHASVEFLREMLEIAREVLVAERMEEAGGLNGISLLPDQNLGALSQILKEYAADQTPEFVASVVSEIDSIVRQVRFQGWTTSQPGDRTIRLEIRRVLRRHGLPTTGSLFDRAYAYIRENY